MANLQVEYLAVSDLKPNPRNARLHSKKQLHQIAASIREFGFNIPVLIDRGNVIIAGHGRVSAARTLGMETDPFCGSSISRARRSGRLPWLTTRSL
jgi:ParB-like chromosome segregation protein Spo0J